MILIEPAPYLPFMDPRMVRRPGLMPLDPGEWATLHADFAAQMAYRDRLAAERREAVIAMAPEGREAAGELLAMLLDHLAARAEWAVGEGSVTRPDGVAVPVDATDPMGTVARLVADDLCVLVPDPGAGEYRLAAAALCFPSRWSLAEKMHRPLTAIHDPVPDYDDELAKRVNRVFEALRPGRPVWRANWTVHASPELFQPLGVDIKLAGRGHAAGDGVYLRTERQTLTRLPATGAVAFGIKTSVTPAGSLAPAEAAALEAALAAMERPVVAYLSGEGFIGRARALLREMALQGGAASASIGEA